MTPILKDQDTFIPMMLNVRQQKVDKEVEKSEPSDTVGEKVNGVATLESSLAVPQKTKYRIVI